MVIGASSSLAIIFAEEERDGCFTLCCGCLCGVSLPHGAMGWSAVCDCGISCSCSFTFFIYPPLRNGTLQNKDIMRDRTLINKGIIPL